MALAEIELRSGSLDAARALLPELLASDKVLRTPLIDLAWSLTGTHQESAFTCADAVVDDYIAQGQFDEAGAVLQEFVVRVPRHVPALLKLIEICVDGGFESTMYEAQTQLTDAYLESGHASEARVVAEDLVAREPWEKAHIERFRSALVMLRVPDPDTLIAERLSGQSPFMATDHFIDLNDPTPEPSVPVGVSYDPPADVAPAEATFELPVESLAAPVDPTAIIDVEDVPVVPVAAAPAKATRGRKSKAAVEAAAAEIDLTGALGGLGEDDGQVNGREIEPVFKELRREVSEQSGADALAQHMTIARAYLEMGLTDEAIPALRTAAKSAALRFEAASLLGRLHKQRGEAHDAIEWFERAAEAPAPSVDDGRALLYELGTTLEDAGETARALAVFLELQAEGGDYRDVRIRTERLAGSQSGG
jgi:tetratricopeptide (TPR) repeat protein